MDKSETMFYTGMAMVTGGAFIASPLDEIAVTSATGGLGAILAPVQGVLTAGVGVMGILGGLGLIYLSTLDEKSKSD